MLARVDGLVDFLLQASLSALILSIIATLAMISTRQPGRRLALARLSLVALLCVPPLTALELVPRLSVTKSIRAILPPAPPPHDEARQVEADRCKEGSRFHAKPALIAFYMAGLAWGFGGMIVSLIGAEWLKRSAEQADPSVLELRDELAHLAGIKPPDVRFCRRIPRPVLSGVWRSCIILPHVFDREADSGALRLAILHECCHLRSCDPCFSVLAHTTRTLWFALPTVWWICAQMRLDQEFQADRFASRLYGPDFSYAKSLVELAEPGGASRRGGGGRALMPRVLMLVRCPFAIETTAPWWWRLSITPAIAIATLLATSLSLGDARSNIPASATVPNKPRDHGVFQLERLNYPVDAGDPSPNVFTLPADLPDDFELSVEVLTVARDLPEYRFADCALTLSENAMAAVGVERWFVVRIRQQEGRLAGWVDDRPAPCRLRQGGHSNRLTLRSPAGRAASFRSLRLSW